MPGSATTPGHPNACDGALGHVAFRFDDSVGTQDKDTFAAQWLACAFPCRRFADILADDCARLGANVDRYSFIAADLHRLLLAGLPAHRQLSWHAYAYGVSSYGRYPGRKFDEVEADLSRDWNSARGKSGLSWDRAKNATRDAWDRISA